MSVVQKHDPSILGPARIDESCEHWAFAKCEHLCQDLRRLSEITMPSFRGSPRDDHRQWFRRVPNI